MAEKIDHILDFRGSISSIALLKMTQIFSEMKPLEIMEILGSDPDTREDLFKVLPDASYRVVCMEVVEDEEYFYRVRIQKQPCAADPSVAPPAASGRAEASKK